MKIDLIWIGKTQEKHVTEGVNEFISRIQRFISFNIVEIKAIKKKVSEQELKKLEAKELLNVLKAYDKVIILDENGEAMDSVAFSKEISRDMNKSYKQICFVIGGAYGFEKTVYIKADKKISLSKMTMNHQLVRLVFVEQLYRAYTIINNLPYHHS